MKGLIRDILTFLRELQENNDREWFAGQKPRYQKLKEGFDELVDRLIAQTAVWDEEVNRGVVCWAGGVIVRNRLC